MKERGIENHNRLKRGLEHFKVPIFVSQLNETIHIPRLLCTIGAGSVPVGLTAYDSRLIAITFPIILIEMVAWAGIIAMNPRFLHRDKSV